MVWIGNAGSEGMTLKKHSPYSPFFKNTYLKLIQSGHMEKLKIKHKSSNICGVIKDDVGTPMSHQKLILLFIIKGGGMIFALVVLFYEILRNLYKPKVKIILLEEPRIREIATQTNSHDKQGEINHKDRIFESKIPRPI